MKNWASRLGRLWVPVILAAFFLWPAGAGAASPQGVLKQAIHWGLSADWLDPSTASYVTTANHPLYFFHDALLKAMPDGSYTPCLAESWSISPDFKVYEFKLRKGVKFHNGDTLTAEDVVFSYWRYKGALAKFFHGRTEKVEAVNPLLVRIHFKECAAGAAASVNTAGSHHTISGLWATGGCKPGLTDPPEGGTPLGPRSSTLSSPKAGHPGAELELRRASCGG